MTTHNACQDARSLKGAESGASMVEFAFAAVIISLILGFVVDGGFTMHRYLRLTHATTELNRTLSTVIGEAMLLNSSDSVPCSELQMIWNAEIDSYLTTKQAATRGFDFEVTEIVTGSGPIPLIQLRGSWQGTCIMCTILEMFASAQFEVTSVLVIESNKTINCNSCAGELTCA